MLALPPHRARRSTRRRITLVEWAAALSAAALLLVGAREIEKHFGMPTELAGFAEAIDGDSLTLAGREIRLQGVDAPELAQWCETRAGRRYACGVEAKRWLNARLRRGAVVCAVAGRDRYGRLLGQCRRGDELLNEAMVREGLAIDYGGYANAQAEARRQGSGLWSGTFTMPAEYRATHPRP